MSDTSAPQTSQALPEFSAAGVLDDSVESEIDRGFRCSACKNPIHFKISRSVIASLYVICSKCPKKYKFEYSKIRDYLISNGYDDPGTGQALPPDEPARPAPSLSGDEAPAPPPAEKARTDPGLAATLEGLRAEVARLAELRDEIRQAREAADAQEQRLAAQLKALEVAQMEFGKDWDHVKQTISKRWLNFTEDVPRRFQSLTRVIQTGESELRQTIEAAAVEALDTQAVGDRILGWFQEQLPAISEQMAASLRPERVRALERLLTDLPNLFDAFDQERTWWESGADLTPEQEAARAVVREVLERLARGLDDWRLRQQLAAFPTASVEPVPYDEARHTRVRTQETDDPARHRTVARVSRSGYQWRGDLLRKAEVEVWGPSAAGGGNGNGNTNPTHIEDGGPSDHERA